MNEGQNSFDDSVMASVLSLSTVFVSGSNCIPSPLVTISMVSRDKYSNSGLSFAICMFLVCRKMALDMFSFDVLFVNSLCFGIRTVSSGLCGQTSWILAPLLINT